MLCCKQEIDESNLLSFLFLLVLVNRHASLAVELSSTGGRSLFNTQLAILEDLLLGGHSRQKVEYLGIINIVWRFSELFRKFVDS